MREYEDLISKIFLDKEYYDLVEDEILQSADLREDFNNYFETKSTGVILALSKLLKAAFDRGSTKVLDEKGNPLNLKKVNYDLTQQELMSYNLKLIKNVDDAIRQKIKKVLSAGVKKGLSYSEMGDEIKKNIKNISINKAKTIARTEVARASTQAQQTLMKANNIRYYKWITANDHKVCPICKGYANKVFEFGKGPLPIRDTHPNCYDDKTEVLTNQGWKLFKDVEDDDLIFSLNPETREVGWQRIKCKVKIREEKMLRFYNNYNFDAVVSPNHNFWHLDKNNNLVVKPAEEMKNKYLFKIPRAIAEYKPKKKLVRIGHHTYDPRKFMRFFGWFLAEGNVSHRKNSWQIKITQKNPYKMVDDLDLFANKLRIGKEAIYLNVDKELGEYLHCLGKSYEKYVPTELKELPKEALLDFLNTFNKGDGSSRFRKSQFKGYDTYERTYFTSSDQLAADIGEILIKVGKYSSYHKMLAKTITFKNGTYKIKHPVWIIRECSRNTLFIKNKYGKVEEVDYGRIAYDVELENWHILLVRRKGKLFWNGNCRCVIVKANKK